MANIISLQQIHDESLWVAKMCGWRHVGTHGEVGHLFYDEDCRDFDMVCAEGQPEHLRPFFEAYEAYEAEHGFTFLNDFYRNVYAVEALKADPSLGEYVEHETDAMRRARMLSESKERVFSAVEHALDELSECECYVEHADGGEVTLVVFDNTDAELVHDVMRDYNFFFCDEEEWCDRRYFRYVCVA